MTTQERKPAATAQEFQGRYPSIAQIPCVRDLLLLLDIEREGASIVRVKAIFQKKLADGRLAEIKRLREVLSLMDVKGERLDIHAPEDDLVGPLCELWGYGAVMSSASRLWRRKDPSGAFMVGPCACIVEGVMKAPLT